MNHIHQEFSCEIINTRFINKMDFKHTLSYKEEKAQTKLFINDLNNYNRDKGYRYLTYDEEIMLFRLVANGDSNAKDRIFHTFLKMVPGTVNYYVGDGVEINDLIQEGSIALLEAIETFNYTLGYRFGGYAKGQIRNKILRALPFYLSAYDLPSDAIPKVRKINKVFDALNQERTCEVSLTDVLKRAELTENTHRRLICIMSPYSLQNLKPGLLDSQPDDTGLSLEKQVEIKVLFEMISNEMDNLRDREEHVLRFLYGLDDRRERSYLEVSIIFDVSVNTIRNVEKRALGKLKERLFLDL